MPFSALPKPILAVSSAFGVYFACFPAFRMLLSYFWGPPMLPRGKKKNLAESERPENRPNRPPKHWKQPKTGLEGPKKALLGLFRPFKVQERPGRL